MHTPIKWESQAFTAELWGGMADHIRAVSTTTQLSLKRHMLGPGMGCG